MRLTYFLRQVNGHSMEPTLKEGRLLIAARKFELKKGNLVIARTAEREIIKRIADIKDSKVYILGDNPDHSTDSRTLGWFEADQIIGTIVWPKTHKV